MICSNTKILSIVDLPFLKPDWVSELILFSSASLSNLFFTSAYNFYAIAVIFLYNSLSFLNFLSCIKTLLCFFSNLPESYLFFTSTLSKILASFIIILSPHISFCRYPVNVSRFFKFHFFIFLDALPPLPSALRLPVLCFHLIRVSTEKNPENLKFSGNFYPWKSWNSHGILLKLLGKFFEFYF